MSSPKPGEKQTLNESGTPANLDGPESRDHLRVSYTADIKVTEIDVHGRSQGTWMCKTSDLSRSGIGLISRRLVHIGREMLLELETDTGKRLLCGVVRHCAYCEGVGHAIGIEFTNPEDNPVIKRWHNMHDSPEVSKTKEPPLAEGTGEG